MKRDVDIGSYLPPITGKKREFKVIAETESQEFTAVWTDVDSVHQNQYLFDSDEYGVKRRERMLKLLPLADDTLDTRKFRIFTKLCASLPYSMPFLEESLKRLCGEDGYYLHLDPSQYLLTIRIMLKNESKFNAVKELIKMMQPTNIVTDLALLRTWGDVNEQFQTWGEVLGIQTWGDIFEKYATWGDLQKAFESWGKVYGERTWGEIFGYI